MMDLRQLSIPGTSLAISSASQAILDAAHEAWKMASEPPSENTQIAYKRGHDRYAKWCDEAHVTPLPCSGAQLVAFLQWLTRQPGSSRSSVMQAASAVASLDKWSRVTPEDPDPTSVLRSMVYIQWRKAWMRRFGKAPKNKAPVPSRDELERVIRSMDEPTPGATSAGWPARRARDRAMWLIGIGGALRVSELVALDAGHVVRVPQGIAIYIASSKTNQTGEPELIGIEPQSVHHLCPVRAWEEWMSARGDWQGPLFCSIGRNGQCGARGRKGPGKRPGAGSGGQHLRLTERGAQKILTENAERAGVRVSSHSLRRLFATRTTKMRKRVDRIMAQARWVRVETLHEYVQTVSIWDDNPTRGFFEGEW